jgi:hypothetical protein
LYRPRVPSVSHVSPLCDLHSLHCLTPFNIYISSCSTCPVRIHPQISSASADIARSTQPSPTQPASTQARPTKQNSERPFEYELTSDIRFLSPASTIQTRKEAQQKGPFPSLSTLSTLPTHVVCPQHRQQAVSQLTITIVPHLVFTHLGTYNINSSTLYPSFLTSSSSYSASTHFDSLSHNHRYIDTEVQSDDTISPTLPAGLWLFRRPRHQPNHQPTLPPRKWATVTLLRSRNSDRCNATTATAHH